MLVTNASVKLIIIHNESTKVTNACRFEEFQSDIELQHSKIIINYSQAEHTSWPSKNFDYIQDVRKETTEERTQFTHHCSKLLMYYH